MVLMRFQIFYKWFKAAKDEYSDDEILAHNFPDSDGDGLYDFEEINFNSGLITFDESGKPIFPNFKKLFDFSHTTPKGFEIFEKYANSNNISYDVSIVPFYSNPTQEDSDGDGILDKKEKQTMKFENYPPKFINCINNDYINQQDIITHNNLFIYNKKTPMNMLYEFFPSLKGQNTLNNNLYTYAYYDAVQNEYIYGMSEKAPEKVQDKSVFYLILAKTLMQMQKENGQKKDGTFSAGLTFSATPSGFNFLGALNLSADFSGNIGFQGTLGAGPTIGTPGISGGPAITITSAPNIYKLNGFAANIGATAAVKYGMGCDLIYMEDKEMKKEYIGASAALLFGAGAEAHYHGTNTSTFLQINIFDVGTKFCDNLLNKIIGE